MYSITQDFFTDIEKRHYEPLLHNASGSIRFDIADAGNWYVIIRNGRLQVSKGTQGADCVCKVQKQDFEKMVVGKQNPFALFLQMKMQCEGNLALAQLFQRLFPDDALINAHTKGEDHE